MFVSRAAVCQLLIKRVPDIMLGAENIAEKNETIALTKHTVLWQRHGWNTESFLIGI